ncbi:MAG TPA: protease, partial [Acetobacteraceae bacterium]|nr:protease [Acetobacteraceae bacterium]
MIRLFLLLLGADVVRRRWRSLIAMGMAWCALGIFIFIDSLDSVTLIPVHGFGWLLLIEGAVSLLAAWAGSGAARGLRLFKAVAVAAIGLLMVDSPFHSDVALALIIGIVFAADGTLKIVSARVVRFPGWRMT